MRDPRANLVVNKMGTGSTSDSDQKHTTGACQKLNQGAPEREGKSNSKANIKAISTAAARALNCVTMLERSPDCKPKQWQRGLEE